MSWPTLTVNAGFGDTMFTASPTWTNIVSYVKEVVIRRGRSSIDGVFRTGKGHILLDNSDGRFTPSNTSGAYYPDVNIGIPFEIKANHASTDYPIMYAVAREWPPQKHGPNYSRVHVPIVDGFYTLNLEDLAGASYSAESTDTRIGNVLDSVGWAAGLRDLDTALASVQARVFPGPGTPGSGLPRPALRHLQDVVESEAGVLYMARDGKVTFKNRLQHAGASSPASPSFDGADFSDIKLTDTDRYLWNVIRVSREDGAQVEVDGSSGAPRSVLTRDVMPMENDAQALNVAEWLSAIFGEQKQRVEQLKFHAIKNANDFTADLLGLELRDYINVQHTPTGGDAVNVDVVVEEITHSIRPGDWQTTLRVAPLSSAETDEYWVLGTSLLGTSTVLA